MKKFTYFVDTLGTWFRATNIGAYFAPLFRPMVTEQDRLYPLQITTAPNEANRLQLVLRNSQHERPGQR